MIMSHTEGTEQTTEHSGTAKIAHVERDEFYVTIYYETLNGTTWYIIIPLDEYELVRNPVQV